MEVPAAPRGEEGVRVRFSYDINGILHVEARHEKTQTHKELVIIGEYNTLTPLEIQQKLAELEKIKPHPLENEENRLLLAWGERLYSEALGDVRENIVRCLSYFTQALNSQRSNRIRKAKKTITGYFEQLSESYRDEDGKLSDFMPDADDED